VELTDNDSDVSQGFPYLHLEERVSERDKAEGKLVHRNARNVELLPRVQRNGPFLYLFKLPPPRRQ